MQSSEMNKVVLNSKSQGCAKIVRMSFMVKTNPFDTISNPAKIQIEILEGRIKVLNQYIDEKKD